MTIDDTVFEHVRGRDRERLGWIRMTSDDLFIAHDLLWRAVSEPTELDKAEQALDAIGLRYLADQWQLEAGPDAMVVQIVEVTADTLTVAPVLDSENVAKAVDLTRRIVLPNPTDQLRAV